MSHYTVTFPGEDEPGNLPPYAAMGAVLGLINTQEDACGKNDTEHTIEFLTSEDSDVLRLRDHLTRYMNEQPLTTQHVVARWCSDGFRQYLIWDPIKGIVDMVED